MEYMEVGDPVSCCEKIEGLLSQGMLNQHLEGSRGVSCMDFRLSPLHHLSLNACTTLYSTYKIRASQSFDGKQIHSFDMSRMSAAYSLLLAGATQHLFLYEPSCITSAATFWINAGESLLCLARSSFWNSCTNCVLENHLPISNLNCPRCLLMEKFELDFSSIQTRKREFDAMSREFFMCVSIMTPKVWSFLVQDCQYLKAIIDPIDFSWLGYLRASCIWDHNTQLLHHNFNLGSESSFNLDSESGVEGGLAKCSDGELVNERRTSIFELGVHCLLYGGYLSCICYGHHQHRTDYIRNVLHS
uniref:[histone H3]-lysine(4) N-trimethyltransferase n=1 Tax=Opuntia streptacantha TaxID=393608 RepID=A0A7C9EEM5_OPUST